MVCTSYSEPPPRAHALSSRARTQTRHKQRTTRSAPYMSRKQAYTARKKKPMQEQAKPTALARRRLRCTPECIVCVVARVRGERCMGTLARRTPPNWDGVLDSALGKSFITRPFLGRRRRVDVVVESLVLRGALSSSPVRRALVWLLCWVWGPT